MKYKRLLNYLNQGFLQMPEDTTRINIDRPVYKQFEFDRVANYIPISFSLRELLARLCTCSCRELILTIIPIFHWISKYKWQKNAMADIIAGLTVAVITIPQTMAYAMLAHVPPVVGLYMAIFPVIMYFFFTTSRHNSMGTFSVISLMTGEIVDMLLSEGTGYTHVQIVATASFLVAIIQMCMYLLRFGLLANLLCDPLTSGFLCGAGLQVIASMLPSILGLKSIHLRTLFTIPNILYDSFVEIPNINHAVVTMSFICIAVAILSNEVVKPWVFDRYGIVLPVELLTIIIATVLTYSFDLSKRYNIDILENVPAGIPRPTLPVFTIIPKIVTKCILIAIVSYSTTITMALMIAAEARYKVKPNQEILAMSMANFAGSFFQCIPISSSLSRTWVQYKTGGKTQFSTIVSAIFMIIVLMYIVPIFNTLPKCVLSSVIVVALKGMLGLARDLPKFFKLDFWDGIVWLSAFVPTVIFNDSVGLFTGITISSVSLFIRANYPYTCVLGRLPGTEIYVDSERFKGLEAIKGVKIFHYCGTLSYTMKLHFQHTIYDAAMLKPTKVLRSYVNPYRRSMFDMGLQGALKLKFLIVDFSALRYIDPSCVELLFNLANEYSEVNVRLYIAGCHKNVFERIKVCERSKPRSHYFTMFPTVHDAVKHAENEMANMELESYNDSDEQLISLSLDNVVIS